MVVSRCSWYLSYSWCFKEEDLVLRALILIAREPIFQVKRSLVLVPPAAVSSLTDASLPIATLITQEAIADAG